MGQNYLMSTVFEERENLVRTVQRQERWQEVAARWK